MLHKEGETTPSATPAGNNTPADDSSPDNENGEEQQTQEEVEFNSLKGPTQARIKKLIQERNEWMGKAQQPVIPPPPPVYAQNPPDVQDAVQKLRGVGMATQDDVKSEVLNTINQFRFGLELDKLEGRYSGEDGRPKFDRDEYSDYVSRHPEYRDYLPEDVYQKMYREELMDWEVNQGTPTKQTTRPLKPTRTTSKEEPMTIESIQQRLKAPDGRQWYEANIDKINAVVQEMDKNR